MAALFMVAKTCKQLKYPSIDNCIKKMWVIYPTTFWLSQLGGRCATGI